MGTQIQDAKRALRQKVRQQLAAMTEAERAAASARARVLLAAQPCWQEARAIFFFAVLFGVLGGNLIFSSGLAPGPKVLKGFFSLALYRRGERGDPTRLQGLQDLRCAFGTLLRVFL